MCTYVNIYFFSIYNSQGEGNSPLHGKTQWGGDTPLSAPLYTLLYVYSYTYFFYKSIHGVNLDSWLYYICFIIIMGRNSTVVVIIFSTSAPLNAWHPPCGPKFPPTPLNGNFGPSIFAPILNPPLSHCPRNFVPNYKFNPPSLRPWGSYSRPWEFLPVDARPLLYVGIYIVSLIPKYWKLPEI